MRRKFLINITFLLTVSILVKAFWVLGIDRTVQNVVGETAYGNYFSLFSFSVLFTLLLDMGLSGFNNRAVSADPARVRIYFGNVLVIRLFLTALYFWSPSALPMPQVTGEADNNTAGSHAEPGDGINDHLAAVEHKRHAVPLY